MGLFNKIFKKSAAKQSFDNVKNQVFEKMGYDEKYIVKNNMFRLSEDDINLMEKDEEIRLISEVLAKVKKTTFAKAFTKVSSAKEKYGLEPSIYAFNGLYRKNDEAVEAFAKKRAEKQEKEVLCLVVQLRPIQIKL